MFKKVFVRFEGWLVKWGYSRRYDPTRVLWQGEGSIIQLDELETAWRRDYKPIRDVEQLCVVQWNPPAPAPATTNGIEFMDALEAFLPLLRKLTPELSSLSFDWDMQVPDNIMATMLSHFVPSIQHFELLMSDRNRSVPLTLNLIGEKMKHLSGLTICAADRTVVSLLRCLPNLQCLNLYNKIGMHETLRQIGRMEKLRELVITCYYVQREWFTPQDFQLLADSIENGLPKLLYFHLDGFPRHQICLHQPEACLLPLYCALGTRKLESWNQPCGVIEYRGDPNADRSIAQPVNLFWASLFRPYQFDRELMRNIINMGPTVDQVLDWKNRQHNLQLPPCNNYDGNLGGWVEAMIAVKDVKRNGCDRLDCFHYLFSQLSPQDTWLTSKFWENKEEEATNADPSDSEPALKKRRLTDNK